MDTGVFQKNLIIYIIKHCNPECNPQMLNAQLTFVNWALYSCYAWAKLRRMRLTLNLS